MQKCGKCGKEYPDEMKDCPQDHNKHSDGGSATLPPIITKVESHTAAASMHSKAITCAVLGILSLFPLLLVGLIFALLSIYFGHVYLKQQRNKAFNRSWKKLAIAGLVIGYIGIGLQFFIGWGGWHAAKNMANEIKCGSNLKQVGLAMIIWSGEHGDVFPKSFMDLTNDLKYPVPLTCPGDSKRLRQLSRNTNAWNPANFSYEFLLPSSPEEQVTNQVIVRCPIHGNMLMGDGSVLRPQDLPTQK